MKILCVHQGVELYGSDRSFVQAVGSLRQLYPSAHISVVLPKQGSLSSYIDPYCNELIYEDVCVLSRRDFRSPVSIVLRLISSVVRATKRIRDYDLVYVNTLVVFAYMLAPIFSRKIFINHIREIPSRSEALVFSVLFKLNKTHLIFNSKSTRDNFFFLNPVSYDVIHNGVPRMRVSDNLRLPGALKMLLIGRINGWKGHELLLDAVSSLLDKGYDINLRIVGGSPPGQHYHQEKIEKRIKDLEISDHVEISSFIDDPTSHYSWTNIVLVPSIKPEPFGRVAIEALSAGRPVVASNHGGPMEILQGEFGGALFKPGDVLDLERCIKKFFEDPGLLATKSKEAYCNFCKNFSEEIFVDRFQNAIERVINGKKIC